MELVLLLSALRRLLPFTCARLVRVFFLTERMRDRVAAAARPVGAGGCMDALAEAKTKQRQRRRRRSHSLDFGWLHPMHGDVVMFLCV